MPINRKNSPNKKRKLRNGSTRRAEQQLGDKGDLPSQSLVEDAAAMASPSLEAQVSFFITQAQKAELREKGYSDDQIAQMKPAEAHRILGLE
jgi:hypothetical protein